MLSVKRNALLKKSLVKNPRVLCSSVASFSACEDHLFFALQLHSLSIYLTFFNLPRPAATAAATAATATA